MGNPRDKQIADALRLADKNKPRNREIIEPFTYGEYGEFRGRDVGKWRTEQGKKRREKSYDPWKDQGNIYTHPSEQRHVPEDPMYYISPEEYREGTQGKGIYALARGGRAGMAVGGNPAVTTAPPIDPTAAATPSVPLITPTTNIGTGAPTVTPTVAPVAQPAVSALPDPYQAYVSSLYQNILGRPAEQSGQQYWVDQLASGQMSEGDILQQFAGSQEFQNLYKTDPSKAIGALYQEALGRTPEQSGLSYWQQQAQQGLALPTMVQNFLQSQEGQGVSNISRMYQDYTGTIPTNEQLAQAGQMLASGKSMADVEQAISNSPESNQYYVNQIYQDLLGRAPDAEGANYWTQQLTSGQITPEDFYNTVQNSNEASSFENSSFIKDEYRGLFGREPTQQELNDALGQLKSGQTDYSKLDSSLSNTDEAKQYAASNFDPYQVAGATVTTNQPRTAYQYSKATDDLVRSLPKEQQMGALLQQEGGMWIEKILNPNTPQEIKDQAMRQLEGIANVVANRAALGLTENNGKKGSPWAGWFNNNDKNSITSQILAPSAFSAMKIGVGKLAKEGYNAIVNNALPNFDNPAYQPIKDMISGVLNNTRPDITNGATHYKANYVHPNWAGGKRGLPFRTDLGGAPGGRGPYHQYYGSSANAQLAKEKRFGSGNVQFAGVTPQSSGVPTDPSLSQQLAQSGAGGNVAGGGMFNPGGGAIGAPADATSGIGSTAGFPTWTPQSTGSLPAVSQVPVNYTQIGTFDPYTSQQTSMGFDPMTGIGLHSPLYAGPGQYINPGISPTATNFSGTLAFGPGFKHGGAVDDALRLARATGGGAWTRKEGKNPKGGLNEKGRASLRAQGHDIKRPQPEGGARKDSFCARMKGMKAKLTSAETANDPNSRINKSLRVWNCHSAGGAVDNALKIAKYPERKKKDWMISHDYEDRGGEMKEMSPDEFLGQTRKLKGTDEERRSINALKGAMERGDHFDPLQLLANGMEDGRHRATAAKELGIKKVPVIDFRASGGEVWDKPRPKSLGKPDPLTSKEKSKAKRMAKAAGRPWPNLVDNMRAARADGGELEADVSYAPDLPLMAQRDPNAEIADAMRASRVAEEERLRDIAKRPSELKGLLDIGSTIGTYGVEKAREMPERAMQDIKQATIEPAKSAYHIAAQSVGAEPFDEENAIKHAMNVAGAIGTGGMSMGRAPKGSIGMFIGPRAVGADLESLEKARALSAIGTPMVGKEGITSKTGWHAAPAEMHLGAMGEQNPTSWWSEISDQPATSEILSYLEDVHYGDQQAKSKAMREGWSSTLGQILEHPELYKTYPHLSDMPVHIEGQTVNPPNYGGFYSPKNKAITIPAHTAYGDPEEAKKTILHEIMHAIQHYEGAESGYNPRLGGVPNPEYVRWNQQLKKYPELKEYHAIQSNPEYIEASSEAEKIFIEKYMPQINELRKKQFDMPRKSPERDAVSDEIKNIINMSNEEINKKFPILDKARKLHESLLERKIKINPPKKQFLDPQEAYYRSRGETQARQVEERANLPKEKLRTIHPEDTLSNMPLGYTYEEQVFRRGHDPYDVIGKTINRIK